MSLPIIRTNFASSSSESHLKLMDRARVPRGRGGGRGCGRVPHRDPPSPSSVSVTSRGSASSSRSSASIIRKEMGGMMDAIFQRLDAPEQDRAQDRQPLYPPAQPAPEQPPPMHPPPAPTPRAQRTPSSPPRAPPAVPPVQMPPPPPPAIFVTPQPTDPFTAAYERFKIGSVEEYDWSGDYQAAEESTTSKSKKKMQESVAEGISVFISRIKSRRFTNETLEILELLFTSRDLPLILETRSKLRELIRSEAVVALREVSVKSASTDEKLCVVQFFVSAFASIGDVESCLALKYEALLLRESKTVGEDDLKVSYQEWVIFAKDSLDNGFYSIAEKGFDKALKCIQSGTGTSIQSSGHGTGLISNDVNDIKRLQDLACSLASSHSVKTQSTQYMKRKADSAEAKQSLQLVKSNQVGSTLFRNGIKKRNAQKLLLSQSRLNLTDICPMPD